MGLTDPDDIIERLTKRKEVQVNLKDVFNAKDLENVIKDNLEGGSEKIKVKGSKGWFTTTKEKARQELINNKNNLFKTDKLKEYVVDNSISVIEKSKSLRDLDTNFDNIASRLGDIGRTNELKIETAQAERQKELTRETPEELTRSELLDLGVQGTSFAKSARRIGIPESDFREALEREGFTITERGTIKK